jgi:hypothetical protein
MLQNLQRLQLAKTKVKESKKTSAKMKGWSAVAIPTVLTKAKRALIKAAKLILTFSEILKPLPTRGFLEARVVNGVGTWRDYFCP